MSTALSTLIMILGLVVLIGYLLIPAQAVDQRPFNIYRTKQACVYLFGNSANPSIAVHEHHGLECE